MLKNQLVLPLFFAAIVICGSASAQQPKAAEEFAQNISKLKTYQADFEQRVHNENGKEIDFSSGTFSIERPDHFRWEIKHPFAQQIVADGAHVFTHDPDLEQVTIQNQPKTLADSPLLLMTSNADQLNKTFEISQVKVDSGQDKQLFQLKPKGDGGVFESVHILFNTGILSELLMVDTLGQHTSVSFTNIQMNLKIDSALFSFVMPEGVDVVDSRMRELKQTDVVDSEQE